MLLRRSEEICPRGTRCLGCKSTLPSMPDDCWHYIVKKDEPWIGPFCNFHCAQVWLKEQPRMKEFEGLYCEHCNKIVNVTSKRSIPSFESKGQTKGPFCDYTCAKKWLRTKGLEQSHAPVI